MSETFHQGDFTLPGEAGYEQLTLSLAKKWGADVIRDSDGTKLSDEIVQAGYGIYSTICIIRQHNEFAQAHPDAQQQTFLCSDPVVAAGDTVTLHPLDGFFDEQFQLNDSPEAMAYWQVYDRTANLEVPRENWTYENGAVTVRPCVPWHEYTVSFLAWRIWEEINMYNHTTNHWTSEHLRQLDPRHPLAWEYLQKWLRDWCEQNPDTTVVRFTSLFYNFVWIFGSDLRRRNRFTDWASYDFTVSPAALKAFEAQYGYALTAEDFINQRKLQVTHMPPTQHKRDYMDFIQAFVAEKAKVLVDIVHQYGKKAYVFYDDSWVGLEPYGKRFASIGFDGLIKCIFSGFECRLCAGAEVPTHEIRLHPYLFPVGLGGLPTFAEGGHPEKDAMDYWCSARRALLRQTVDRIGLGGYLHLTIGQPAFVDTIERIGVEFRKIKALHRAGAPYTLPIRVAVLHTWGALRSWTLSGHFHETYMHPLIHINEALSGLPVEVKFISFEDAENGALDGVDAVINAGRAGDAWSGGDAWKSDRLVEKLTEFVYNGGCFIGVDEPSAVPGYHAFFRMAPVLGIDLDTGARVCHGKWEYKLDKTLGIQEGSANLKDKDHLYLTDGKAQVLAEANGVPQMTVNHFGKGLGVYMSDFQVSPQNTRMLLDLLLLAAGLTDQAPYISGDCRVEAAYYPESHTLIVINNATEYVETTVSLPDENWLDVTLAPMETKEIIL
ncbi:MAG: 1,3-beta-galactosyl-N-acetylhexosamine phosphorylase [Clostridia bacterium]|nr:1,3-beta-galactosyl-N-acetylhexosamine phosphorylase [Clostridia bacterium]